MSRGFLESLYDLAWGPALPFLARHPRLKAGWDQRVLRSGVPAPADVWIQAASAGEAYLAREIVTRLHPNGEGGLGLLLTANTAQGLSILEGAAAGTRPGVRAACAYFPLDRPRIMDRALAAVRPQVAVLLEGELWPGFLAACRRQGTYVLVANGRMTERTFRRHQTLGLAARYLRPDKVLAMSEADAARFAALFGPQRVEVMPNMKFDRLAEAAPPDTGRLAGLLPSGTEFVVLGSVRKEEEPLLLPVLAGLLARRPGVIVGLFPRHAERLAAWAGHLKREGLPFARRSELAGPARPGTVLLWDAFGELGAAYGLAQAAFVGGSLAPLGGQNFLEPLTGGLVPVIGPSWSNFAWVGGEILDEGLVRQVPDGETLLATLLATLDRPTDREVVRAGALAYVARRTGGSETVCRHIADRLKKG